MTTLPWSHDQATIWSYDFIGLKMRAGVFQLKSSVIILIIISCLYSSCQLTQLQVCKLCSETVLNDTSLVGQFCSSSAGRIDGRCCLQNDNNTSDPQYVIGLDLSNCSLSNVSDLREASTAVIIDLSHNPIDNLSDKVFQGFIDLKQLILPSNQVCPGGNASWEKVEVKEGNRLCQDPVNLCNQAGQLALDCPENSLCAPYGPGFSECKCTGKHHGYKCLREGQFPILLVFAPLGGSTVLVATILWVTQRRKVKST